MGEGGVKEQMNLNVRAWIERASGALRPLVKRIAKLVRGEEEPAPVRVRVNRRGRERG